jgi:hypothetical protein
MNSYTTAQPGWFIFLRTDDGWAPAPVLSFQNGGRCVTIEHPSDGMVGIAGPSTDTPVCHAKWLPSAAPDDWYWSEDGRPITRKEWRALQGLEPEYEAEEEEEDDGVDLNTLDRNGLKKLIKENELGIKVFKSMADDDIRWAISEALSNMAEEDK